MSATREGVFQTMFIWKDFIIPNVCISSPGKRTLVLQAFAAVGQFSIHWPVCMTGTGARAPAFSGGSGDGAVCR